MPVVRETVVFDRIFDVQRREGRRSHQRCTDFSFQQGARKVYGVTVQGWPLLEAGHRVTVVLGEPGNWQRLLGWKNHNTGEHILHSAPPVWDAPLRFALFTWLAYALYANAETPTGRHWALAAAAVLMIVSTAMLLDDIRDRRRARAVRRALAMAS